MLSASDTARLPNVAASGLTFTTDRLAVASMQGRFVIPSHAEGLPARLRTGFAASAGYLDFVKHQVVVQDIILDRPLVSIGLDANGQWHFPGSGLLNTASDATTAKPEGIASTVVNLRTSRAGQLQFTDRRRIQSYQLTLEEFGGEVHQLHTLAHPPTRFEFWGARQNGGRASLSGVISNPAAGTLTGELVVTGWPLEDLRVYSEHFLGLRFTGGYGGLNLSFARAFHRLEGVLGVSMDQPSFRQMNAQSRDAEVHLPAPASDPNTADTSRIELGEEVLPSRSIGTQAAAILNLLRHHSAVVRIDIPFAGSVSRPVLNLDSALAAVLVPAAREIATATFGLKRTAAAALPATTGRSTTGP